MTCGVDCGVQEFHQSFRKTGEVGGGESFGERSVGGSARLEIQAAVSVPLPFAALFAVGEITLHLSVLDMTFFSTVVSQGPLLCSVAVLIWLLLVMAEWHKSVSFMTAVWSAFVSTAAKRDGAAPLAPAFACQECSRAVGKATRADLTRLKRTGRYLLHTPRAVWEFPLQHEENIVVTDGLSDADAAGCPKTRP